MGPAYTRMRASACMCILLCGQGTCEEQEDAVAHGAEHGGEALPDDKGEQHVGGHIDARTGRARLQGLNLPAAEQELVVLQTGSICNAKR